MPKLLTVALLIACFYTPVHAQTKDFWEVLAEVGFKTRKDSEGNIIEVPVFGKNIKSWNGKKIRLKGYIVPVNETGNPDKFMLSSVPFNMCYFCGGAGPETVIEVESDESIRYITKAIWVEGWLQLNESDPERHMYILKSAQLISLPSIDAKATRDSQ